MYFSWTLFEKQKNMHTSDRGQCLLRSGKRGGKMVREGLWLNGALYRGQTPSSLRNINVFSSFCSHVPDPMYIFRSSGSSGKKNMLDALARFQFLHSSL